MLLVEVRHIHHLHHLHLHHHLLLQFLPQFHLEDAIQRLIQLFQDQQRLYQFQLLDTLLLQDKVLFMDHAQLLLHVQLEITLNTMDISLMASLMLLESIEYYLVDLFHLIF